MGSRENVYVVDARGIEETIFADGKELEGMFDAGIIVRQIAHDTLPHTRSLKMEFNLLFDNLRSLHTRSRSRSSSCFSPWSEICSPPHSPFEAIEYASDEEDYSVRSFAFEPPSPFKGPDLAQCTGGACCSAEHIKRLLEGALGSGQGPVYIGCSFTVTTGDTFHGPISHAIVGGHKNNNRGTCFSTDLIAS